MSTSDGVQKRNAFAACADLALPAFRGPLAVSCRIGNSVKRAWRLPQLHVHRQVSHANGPATPGEIGQRR